MSKAGKAKSTRLTRVIDRLLSDLESYEGSKLKDLSQLWRDYLSAHKIRIFLALGITSVWCLFPYATAILARFLVDDVLLVNGAYDPSMIQQQMPLFWRYSILLVGIWTIFVIANWLKNWLIVDTGQRVVYQLRKRLHEKLQALHIGYFESNETGKVVSRVLDDVKVIKEWSTNQFLNFSANFIRLFLGLIIIFFINWKLSLLVVVVLPFYAYAFSRLRPLVRRTSIAVRRLNSGMYALSSERISGISVVQAFSQEGHELNRFRHRMNNFVRLGMRLILYQQRLALIAGLITAVISGVIIYFGVGFVRTGEMSFGDVIAFIRIMPNLFAQVNAVTTLLAQVEAIFVVIHRVFHLLDEFEEVTPGKIKLDGMKGKIDFRNVSFSYPGQESPAIRDVSFHIDEGERIALMGPSGAGKTTIFQLICRFYDSQSGSVHLGGVNLVDADSGSIRRHARMVQQEPAIFSGTIAENIAYGDLAAMPTQLMTATTQAELHEFIMSLPAKYETEVGRNGIALSGGQKQRLALSTALLTQPEILLLDDTTSALDAETEMRIRSTLNRVLEGRTSIIITQRIATARGCDRILVFEDGELTQEGTHTDLKEQEGFYRRIYKQQESI
ncbi:MAG: ABC transporter ATP-binding protein [Spirochaetales bacterium]|jgi:ABC-type multidrug transport system fused ATPase/permease subunit|nr:ABC transporter ATP-binding protein [Spirochaetales bacterium]